MHLQHKLLLQCLLLLCAMSLPVASIRAEDRIVIAHLMHQMSIGAECKPTEGPFAREPSRPDEQLAQHIPEYLPNYRQPLAAARQDVAMAKAAGINAFSMLLSGSHLPSSQFATIIHAYYQAAGEAGGMKIAPDIWETADNTGHYDKVGQALELLHRQYESTWLTYQGKYVIFLEMGRPEKPLSPDVALPLLMDRIGGRSKVLLMIYNASFVKKTYPEWFAAADGFVEWPTMDYGQSFPEELNNQACAKEAGKLYWYAAMPSFTQCRPNLRPNVREKLGMTQFVLEWQRAIADRAPAVTLPTWNDLTEDSAVMPESNHGWAFYELNRYYAQWFQTGQPPVVNREQVLLFHHPQLVDDVKVPADRQPMSAFPWARTTPPTDYVGIVGMLREPATVAILLGENEIARKDLPAGMHVWLAYHPQPKQGGRNDQAPPIYPAESTGLAITLLDQPLRDAQLHVVVYRNSRRLGVFRSHRSICAAAGRGELTTIGDVFPLGTEP